MKQTTRSKGSKIPISEKELKEQKKKKKKDKEEKKELPPANPQKVFPGYKPKKHNKYYGI